MPFTRASLETAEEETAFQGIPVIIEHPEGSTRTGTDSKGEEWSREMLADYGRIPDTSSKGDGEEVDVYIGPDQEALTAYVVEQLKEDGSFDEVKILLGFKDEDAALFCYLAHYPEDWKSQVGNVSPLSVDRLRELVKEDQAKEVTRSKYARFLMESEVRAEARRYMETPKFRQIMNAVAPGKSWEEMTHSEQILVLQKEQRRVLAGPGVSS